MHGDFHSCAGEPIKLFFAAQECEPTLRFFGIVSVPSVEFDSLCDEVRAILSLKQPRSRQTLLKQSRGLAFRSYRVCLPGPVKRSRKAGVKESEALPSRVPMDAIRVLTCEDAQGVCGD